MNRSLQRKIAILISMKSDQVTKGTKHLREQFDKLKRAGATAFRYISIAAAVAGAGLLALTKNIIQTGMQFEKFGIQLGVLYRSAEKGQQKFEWIKRFAATTPYELEQVVDATVKLKATGLDAEVVLRDLGDLASAAQKPLQQVVMAVSNIASGLKGLGMKQLRLLNISNKMMQEQGVIFDAQGSIVNTSLDAILSLQRIIKQRFSGMMIEQSKTMAGVITNIKDVWTQVKNFIADGINPIIKRDLEKIRDWAWEALANGELQKKGTAIGEKLALVYTKVKEIFPKILSAAKSFWAFIGPPLQWLIENPEIVKNAAIVLIMTKLVTLAYNFGKGLKYAFIMISRNLTVAVGKLAVRMGLVAANAAAISTAQAATTAGGVATGFKGIVTAAGASAAGTGAMASIASIVPIVVGVLGAAAVGYAVYKIYKNHASKAERAANSVNETHARLADTRSKLEGTPDQTGKTTGGALQLYKRYVDLANIIPKTTEQQAEYNATIVKLGKLFPDAVTKADKYGDAVEINARKIDTGVIALKNMYIAQQQLLSSQKEGLLDALVGSVKSTDLKKLDQLKDKIASFKIVPNATFAQNKLDGIDKAHEQLVALEQEQIAVKAHLDDLVANQPNNMAASSTAINQTGQAFVKWEQQVNAAKMQLAGINSELASMALASRMDLKIQVEAELQETQLTKNLEDMESKAETIFGQLSAAFPDMTSEVIAGSFRQWFREERKGTEDELALWETHLAEYQERMRAPVVGNKSVDETFQKQMDANAALAGEQLTEFMESLTADFGRYEETRFEQSIAHLGEYEQKRAEIEKKYREKQADLVADEKIIMDVDDEALMQKGADISARTRDLSDQLSEVQKKMAEGLLPDTADDDLRVAIKHGTEAYSAWLDEVRAKSENFRGAMESINKAKSEGLELIDKQELVDKAEAGKKGVVEIKEDLANREAQIDELRQQIMLAKESAFQQDRMAIIREGTNNALAIMDMFTTGQISFFEAAQLAQQASLTSQQEAAYMAYSRIAEIEEELRFGTMNGMEIDKDRRIELQTEISDILASLEEKDFKTKQDYEDAKARLEKLTADKSIKTQKAYYKIVEKTALTAFSTMFRAGQLWATGEMKMRDAVKVAALESVSEIVAGSLEVQGKAWAVEAAAAAAKLNFSKAAGLAAAATAAGVASGWIRARADASISAIERNYETGAEDELDALESDNISSGAVTQSAYSTRGVQNMYISPSVTITGETIIIGDEIDNASEKIGQICVQAVQEAVDTGQLSLGVA